MAHEEYIRLVTGADTAILFIHGILGTPEHFRELIPLVPPEWSVCNILLPGHGGRVEDFSGSSMEQWRSYVDGKVSMLLKDHRRLFIAAHSMGTLFAIEQAIKEPERISGLFLLAVPLRAGLRTRMVANAWKVFRGRIDPADTLAVATRDACSITQDKRIWLYLGWIGRYLELFRMMGITREALSELKVPGTAFQSGRDEMVSQRSLADMACCPALNVYVLESSGHFYYHPDDLTILKEGFRNFVK